MKKSLKQLFPACSMGLLILLASWLGAGCATSPSASPALLAPLPEQAAVVYFILPRDTVSTAAKYPIFINQAEVYRLDKGQATRIYCLPGEHLIRVRSFGVWNRTPTEASLDVSLEAGQKYYFEIGNRIGSVELKAVSPAEGEYKLRSVRRDWEPQ